MAGLNPDSNDEGGEDFLEDNLSVHLEDHYLSDDYDSSSEVASGVFNASHAIAFEEPKSFKEHLWNLAGPSVGSMSIFLNLLKDNLEEDEAGPSRIRQNSRAATYSLGRGSRQGMQGPNQVHR